MARRDHSFAINEYYHCYNRGTDKREVFLDPQDFSYYLKSLKAYNDTNAYGKLRLHDENATGKKIVEIVTYSLLPNHFHLVLRQLEENGVSKFLQRVGIGYSMYFNLKYKRSGSLFQGTFKSRHIPTDQDLRQVIAYVYHNNLIHNITNPMKFRSNINQNTQIIRDLNSNNKDIGNLAEIAEIIKQQRLAFDEQ
jgi:REP element-mobilizing transposase RayT